MKKSTGCERERHKELVRWLIDAEIPVPISPEDEPNVSIRQDETNGGTVFDLSGGAGLIVTIWLVPNIPVLALSGVNVFLNLWPGARFWPLEEHWNGESPHYRFYGRKGLQFDRGETINRLLIPGTKIRSGYPVYGRLLLRSYDPMPSNISNGTRLHGSMKIFDQWEHEHSAEISLGVVRHPERKVAESHLRRQLLVCPDR